jgi:hypothetical protein
LPNHLVRCEAQPGTVTVIVPRSGIVNGKVYSQPSYFKPDTGFDPQWRKTPEQKLMLAVLDDAVSRFQKYSAARDKLGTSLFRQAEEWILQQGKSNWLFSFDNICATLDLNPGCIREGLLHWRDHRLRERHGVRLRMNKCRYASRN